MNRGIPFLGLSLLLVVASCDRKPAQTGAVRHPADRPAAGTNLQFYQVKGVIVELLPAEKSVRIRHEEVPDYMPAMTMPFDVKDTKELAGLSAGDTVAFRMVVTETDGWIDQIQKLDVPQVNTLPAGAPIRIVRDVEPLEIGDALPEYHFTNQLGQAVSLSQFRGQALAFTFIFTRCPFPKFCPLMSNHFQAVREALQSDPNAPTNWHLLTISFDPEYDTPERLKQYAGKYQADPARWSFLTGALIDITALGEQVGLQFWKDPEVGINHNLRTVVADADGRLRAVFSGNEWTAEELTRALVQAAGK